MRALLVIAAVALTVPAAAVAAPPEGFRTSKSLSVRAAKIVGKPTPVYCARTAGAWAEFMVGRGSPHVDGLTSMPERYVHLPIRNCVPLERWLRGKRVPLRRLGVALHVFAHELQHARGIRNEATADCTALRVLPTIAHRYFGVKSPRTLRALTRAARAYSYCPTR